MKKILIKLIEKYQKYISPDHSDWAKKNNKPPYCKFTPSCSEYTKQAIEKKGVFKGSMMGIWRIMRCNPWSKGGYDPVEKNDKK
ncbi:MAG: membrane protein insertion efficiency factor YidD [Candidatus Gracilibacteria bacterium]|nr:membrane protein insertion efficiency factor YidD [Candidatus Gracilibacteria bacterium]